MPSSSAGSDLRLHIPPRDMIGKRRIRLFKEQPPFLTVNHDRIARAPRPATIEVCGAIILHRVDLERATVRPGDGTRLHIAGTVKVRIHGHINFFTMHTLGLYTLILCYSSSSASSNAASMRSNWSPTGKASSSTAPSTRPKQRASVSSLTVIVL